MENKTSKERGILKLEPRPRSYTESRCELNTQRSWELTPSSPQPSVDRLSVTWADPEETMASGVNLFHLPADGGASTEVKFSPAADGSDDEDYSASLSAVLRQRRASVRRSRKGRVRRPSSPFLPDDTRPRRRSSAFTTSSGDTAISMEEQPAAVTQEQIMENIHLHKEVLGAVKQQPYDMRRKIKIVHQAKSYIKRHEGQLQERLAQSKSTKDIYARFNIFLSTKWQQMKREAANMSNLMIPWELRIKEIESHFGSVVASYFTFLRWLFWVNLVIAFILLLFVIVPEYLTANPDADGERKIILEDERRNATNLLTLWEFDGVLKCSPIFYGYYSNINRPEYRMPLAYFMTGLVVYIYSFVATLRKMAENSRMSKLSEKEDECIFSWKLFTGWDFMIGNAETAHNRIASVILGFKEALLEEAEKKKDLRNWRIISLRALVNICVILLLAVSAYAVVTVVTRSDDHHKVHSWWRENETTIVVTVISITFPILFELLGFLEHYHPRKQLRLQLARIMLLNLLNLYSLIFALFSKIEGMSKELDSLQPSLNDTLVPIDPRMVLNSSMEINDTIRNDSGNCSEVKVPCMPCELLINLPISSILTTLGVSTFTTSPTYTEKKITTKHPKTESTQPYFQNKATTPRNISAESLIELSTNIINEFETTTYNTVDLSIQDELLRLREIAVETMNETEANATTLEIYDDDNDYTFEDFSYEITSTTDMEKPTSKIQLSTDFTTEGYEEMTSLNEKSSSIDHTSTNFEESTTNFNTSTSDTETTQTMWTVADITREVQTSTDNIIEFKTTTEAQTEPSDSTKLYMTLPDDIISSQEDNNTSMFTLSGNNVCPDMTFKCTISCSGVNITQIYVISNCKVLEKYCVVKQCDSPEVETNINFTAKSSQINSTAIDIASTAIDIAYVDKNNRKMYNLTIKTKKKLLKLCWETMFGQELVKLTMMDLVFVLLGTLFMDFFRALFVRYMNRCWCWDLEKKFPEYGDFKIAENILHLINNQGMVWMGMFFSPGLVVLNVFKLIIMMYLRSWAVMTCNVPHEVVFRVSKSNNFYLALLLTMLFLCVLPVGYSIVWVKPSWHCGPFSEYDKIYHILTNNIYKILPNSLNFALEYIASPAIVIPLLVLLILIIYYLTSLTNSLREANNDLKIQLRRERTEERRKMFQLADTRRKGGSAATDNTPFSRWKKALPALPLGKSIDSDDRKDAPGEDGNEPTKISKKRGGIFAKIVGMALDRKSDVDEVTDINVSPSTNADDETDTDFHETLPKDVLKIKDITIVKSSDLQKKRQSVEFIPIPEVKKRLGLVKAIDKFRVGSIKEIEISETKPNEEIMKKMPIKLESADKTVTKEKSPRKDHEIKEDDNIHSDRKIKKKQTSESSIQSKQSDSISSVIPVITISTTESDDDMIKNKNKIKDKDRKHSVQVKEDNIEELENVKKSSSDTKTLRRQSSVDSIKEQKGPKDKKDEQGHKYQYSL